MIKERTGFYAAVLLCFLGSLYGSHVLSQPYKPVSEISDNTGGQGIDISKLNKKKERFQDAWNKSPEAQGVIAARCGDGWFRSVMESDSENKMQGYFKSCSQTLSSDKYHKLFKDLLNEFGIWKNNKDVPYDKIFPETYNGVLATNTNIVHNNNSSYCRSSREVNPRNPSSTNCVPFSAGFASANRIALLEQEDFQAFLKDRGELMTIHGCDSNSHSMADCLTHRIPDNSKNCLLKKGFKICRPFLPCERDKKVKQIVALFPELTKEDKSGMKYICWKAATQGAQCCMNPEKCPTKGAFSGIASALKQAAPGLVQQYAQMQAMKGDYEAACRARLMANASGPLSQLQSNTCQKSITTCEDTCEDTCDKAVQDFKTRLKQAVAGEKAGRVHIDQIMEAAETINDGKEILTKETDDEGGGGETQIDTENMTCALAALKINKDFKRLKEDSKKMIGLKESSNHASVVDCSGEANKYSLYNQGGGAGSSRGGMNPLAAHMCRQGAPDGVIPPPRPGVSPTRNPNMGSGHLFGGKTTPGFKPLPFPGGARAPADDEFISPEDGPKGMGQLSGGWTGASGDSASGGAGGASGGGSPGSPSRGDEDSYKLAPLENPLEKV